jgi:phospholipid/cholesterol/gamma-HCH transport system substrate-binding protein
VALNDDLAQFTNSFTNTDQELATTVKKIDELLTTAHQFVKDNGSLLAKDVNNLADVTNAILQPEPRNGLETALHVVPNLGANFLNVYEPTNGATTAIPVINNFANPMQFLCSSIQAGSRLGYQDSAELCAQYLAPILDAIKFNFPPFGFNQFTTAATLPKHVTYSEPRLQPPPGYKDTTVPGIWSRDTLFSHGNHEPGWIVAPGMQGVDVQPFTANMLMPESLGELLGGPDVAPPTAGTTLPGPPNAYDQNNPLPPPWYPQPLPTALMPAPAGPLPAEAPLGAANAPAPTGPGQ